MKCLHLYRAFMNLFFWQISRAQSNVTMKYNPSRSRPSETFEKSSLALSFMFHLTRVSQGWQVYEVTYSNM